MRVVSASRHINASAEAIFDLLADPARHQEIDGSGSVGEGNPHNPKRLALGDKFGMSMRLGVPYRITNEVVEFDENRRIAWRHFGHHVWRYELEPNETGTTVTESFDWSDARFPPAYEWLGWPARNEANIPATLERLAAVMEPTT